MKKIFILVIAILFVFTLSSCAEDEVDITIVVYTENPTETIEALDDLPELLVTELQELGVVFTRVVVQTSNSLSTIESNLIDGSVDIAILDSETSLSTTMTRVLDVVIDEQNHPDGDMDPTTYQKAVVVSSTMNGDSLKDAYVGTPLFTDLNGLNVCSTSEDEELVEDYAISLGALSISDITITHTTSLTNDVYESLENGTCDLGVVTLEEVESYASLWDENENTIYETLAVLHVFDSIPYGGLYVSSNQNLATTNALMQAFIQLSSHSINDDILEVLGHDGYYIAN